MTEKILDSAALRQFTGTEHYYPHPLARNVHYTDGAKYVADTAEAYWLIDEIALAQSYEPAVRTLQYQFWTLIVGPNATATLTCADGDRNPVFTKRIEYTDFPPEGIELWCFDKIIFLPSEN